ERGRCVSDARVLRGRWDAGHGGNITVVAPDTSEPDRLAATTLGAGPRVALIHGFTQTNRCWGPLLGPPAADHDAVPVAPPGRGVSAAIAADLVAGGARLGATGGRASYVGYSMGGRFALRVAVDRPDLVQALVLISASPGIADDAARAARRAEDERRATRV